MGNVVNKFPYLDKINDFSRTINTIQIDSRKRALFEYINNLTMH